MSEAMNLDFTINWKYLGVLLFIPLHFLLMEVGDSPKYNNDLEYYIRLPILILFYLFWIKALSNYATPKLTYNQYRFFYYPMILAIPIAFMMSIYENVSILYDSSLVIDFEPGWIAFRFGFMYFLFVLFTGEGQYERFKEELQSKG